MTPIWKDYYVTLSNSTPSEGVAFVVKVGTSRTTIFTGRAYAKPDGDDISVRLNDIVAPHFRRAFTLIEGSSDEPLLSVRVEDANGSLIASEIFRDDWSYDKYFDYSFSEATILNRPIIEAVAAGQYIPVTNVGDDMKYLYIYGSGGQTISVSPRLTTFALTGTGLTGARIANGETYPVLDCIRWVVYYVNAYGGWDWLLVRGNVVEGDNLTRYTFDRDINNGDGALYVQKRGRLNYASEVLHTYTINTGPLSEAESLRMDNLLATNTAYLHDIATGIIVPINITGNNYTYKRGAGFQQYSIGAELAQQRIRR